MKERRQTTFSGQLLFVTSIGVILSAILSSLATSWIAIDRSKEELIESGKNMTAFLVQQSGLAVLYYSKSSAKQATDSIFQNKDVRYVSISDSSGKILYRSGSDMGFHNACRLNQGSPNQIGWGDTDKGISFSGSVWVDRDEIVDLDGGANKDEKEVVGFVCLGMSKSRLNETGLAITGGNTLVMISVNGILLVSLWGVTKRVTKPIRDLSGIMNGAQKGDSKVRAKVGGPSDICEMSKAFNEMMDAFEERDARLRTQKKELKIARDAAVDSAKAKQSFLANISHEIRTPMNGVLGMASILMKSQLSEKQMACVNTINASGKTLLKMIDDILDFSKAESGKLKFEELMFSPTQVAQESVELFYGIAKQNGVNIYIKAKSCAPDSWVGDPTRFKQILTNLIGNAVKFTQAGEIVITIGGIIKNDGMNELVVSVSDTGIGIKEESLNKIFDSFTQADGSTTRKYGGTGLGLSICKQLVERMGGEIYAESEEGLGSKFEFVVRRKNVGGGEVEERKEAEPFTAVMLSKNIIETEIVTERVKAAGGSIVVEDEVDGFVRSLNELRPKYLIFDRDENSCIREAALNLARDQMDSDTKVLIIGDSAYKDLGQPRVNYCCISRPLFPSKVDDILDDRGKPQKNGEDEFIARASSASVLVVDDCDVNLKVIESMMHEFGIGSIYSARNGEEAVNKGLSGPIDLILMDCRMPTMDGYSATRILKSDERSAHIPIVAMTTSITDDDLENCSKCGMNAFISKPVDMLELRELLTEFLFKKEAQEDGNDAGLDGMTSIDVGVAKKLKELAGGAYKSIVTTFIESGDEDIAALRDAIEQVNIELIVRIVHRLKSASMQMGATKLSGFFASMEACAAREFNDVRSLYSDIEREWKKVKIDLRSA